MNPTAAGALRALVPVLRCGSSARLALTEWHRGASGEASEVLGRVAGLARLGAPLTACVEAARPVLGGSTDATIVAFEMHRRAGIDLARLIEVIAGRIAAGDREDAGALAHAAGATTSARLIAYLPLATLPMNPMSISAVGRPVGLLSVVAGLALAFAGARWIGRLLPRSRDHLCGDRLLPHVIVLALRAGLPLPVALEIAGSVDGSGGIARARRRVRLGQRWQDALASELDSNSSWLADAVGSTQASGAPLADRIETLGAERDIRAGIEHDEAIRRAPVKMAIPLVCCVLPSFVLLGIAPHLVAV